MTTTDISTLYFLDVLEKEIKFKGGFDKARKHFDVSESFLRSVVNGTNLPGPKILKKLKLEPIKEIRYRYKPLKGFRVRVKAEL